LWFLKINQAQHRRWIFYPIEEKGEAVTFLSKGHMYKLILKRKTFNPL